MDELVLNRPLMIHDLITMANRELSAFFGAVTELFGPEEAEQSAEDWLEELTASRDLSSFHWSMANSHCRGRGTARQSSEPF